MSMMLMQRFLQLGVEGQILDRLYWVTDGHFQFFV